MNKAVRRTHTFSIGLRPVFTSYIGNTRLEYAPFFYQSLYKKSMGEEFCSFDLGLKAELGLALQQQLTTFTEYTYTNGGNKADTIDIVSHKLLAGLAYRF